MSLDPRVSDDIFIHLPPHLSQPSQPSNGSPSNEPHSGPTRLIFFLTGNPGLLAYYHAFLTLLATSDAARDHYVIVGMSLGGFEAAGEEMEETDEELLFPDAVAARRSEKRRGEDGTQEWWGLEQQVDLAVARVDEVVRRLGGGKKGVGEVRVTLMGHSVGTWLALEVVRRVAERREQGEGPREDAGGVLGAGPEVGGATTVSDWSVEACVLLAPTITDLALSPSGVKAAWVVARLPSLSWVLERLADGLTWATSESTMRWLVARFMGLDGELDGVRTTTRFLRSGGGVRQALEMGKQELVSIAADDWGEEVWGSGKSVNHGEWAGTGGPRMYLLWAKSDHWVATKTRDEILSTRGRIDGVGAFHVDEKEGLVHAWCLRQSRAVSEYVKPWLEQIRQASGS